MSLEESHEQYWQLLVWDNAKLGNCFARNLAASAGPIQ
jgi:hypothetical protein